jgi:CRP-like cAMP-binding protein
MLGFLNNPLVLKKIEERYGAYYDKKQVIFKEGERATQFYLIREGYVKIYKSYLREEITINIKKPGDLFGEAALLSEHKRTASAATLTDCFLVTLNENVLFKLMESDKQFVMDFLRELTNRTRSLSNMVRDLTIGDDTNIVTTHLANFVNIVYAEEQTTITRSIDDIVRYIVKESGIDKEDVMKALRKLQKENYISMDGKNIHIINKDIFLNAIPKYF